ncbi:hypothetical protein TWF106_009822 [Orbilia oligospora]|uniref:Uncharacterized protein n=1 Tax=Orbilia oligospora TaxID=2813651 RepID=A0A7C8QHT0_ORBOL|nr:hypothetical protein TWF788_010153 [Orbilia oligospora]KAF3212452.1 hypothetical protein TWF106_009822 [Orbilia oligospora]
MSNFNRSYGRCTCCRDNPCLSDFGRGHSGHCPHCIFWSNNRQPCPWDYCPGDCNGTCQPQGPRREPGRVWAANEIHRQQGNQNYPLTDFDDPDLTLCTDRAGAERRRLMRFEATFEEFCQGETLTNPPHNPIRRQESPPPDYYRDLGFSRDVPRSEPREIIYPPGRRHHLSRDYNSLQDPNPGPFGVSYNEPRDVHRFDPENRRPSTSGFESDWDPWPEHQRQMRGERRYD